MKKTTENAIENTLSTLASNEPEEPKYNIIKVFYSTPETIKNEIYDVYNNSYNISNRKIDINTINFVFNGSNTLFKTLFSKVSLPSEVVKDLKYKKTFTDSKSDRYYSSYYMQINCFSKKLPFIAILSNGNVHINLEIYEIIKNIKGEENTELFIEEQLLHIDDCLSIASETMSMRTEKSKNIIESRLLSEAEKIINEYDSKYLSDDEKSINSIRYQLSGSIKKILRDYSDKLYKINNKFEDPRNIIETFVNEVKTDTSKTAYSNIISKIINRYETNERNAHNKIYRDVQKFYLNLFKAGFTSIDSVIVSEENEKILKRIKSLNNSNDVYCAFIKKVNIKPTHFYAGGELYEFPDDTFGKKYFVHYLGIVVFNSHSIMYIAIPEDHHPNVQNGTWRLCNGTVSVPTTMEKLKENIDNNSLYLKTLSADLENILRMPNGDSPYNYLPNSLINKLHKMTPVKQKHNTNDVIGKVNNSANKVKMVEL